MKFKFRTDKFLEGSVTIGLCIGCLQIRRMQETFLVLNVNWWKLMSKKRKVVIMSTYKTKVEIIH